MLIKVKIQERERERERERGRREMLMPTLSQTLVIFKVSLSLTL